LLAEAEVLRVQSPHSEVAAQVVAADSVHKVVVARQSNVDQSALMTMSSWALVVVEQDTAALAQAALVVSPLVPQQQAQRV
jgi:hypothetical protein